MGSDHRTSKFWEDAMSVLIWVSHHRLWAGAIGFAVIVAAAIAAVWLVVLRSPGTQISQMQALDIYHRAQPTKDSSNVLLPESGIYRYRSSGSEHLSMGDIGRAFPTVSDMIVTEGKCATMQWEPLVQHTEGLVMCRQGNGALNIESTSSYEDIAGTQTSSVITCPSDTYLVPPHPFIGERWSSTCRSKGERIVFDGRVLGTSTVNVGGQPEATVHTRLVLAFSGVEDGINPNDYWVSVKNGLILRQQETVAISQQAGPLGAVRYTEQMAIALSSAQPIR
jgi:hypothetical protein